MKIKAKYAPIIFGTIMSLMMSCVMSGALGLYYGGVRPDFFEAWMQSWAIAFALAFPLVQILQPLVRKLLSYIVEGEK